MERKEPPSRVEERKTTVTAVEKLDCNRDP
jgi:hypothetical protein